MFDMSDLDPEPPRYTVSAACDRIIQIVAYWAEQCPTSFGWGYSEIGDLLSSSVMQRHLAMAETQKRWLGRLSGQVCEGDLLLAWVNLGCLAEGALKVFFCVYSQQYVEDDSAPKREKDGRSEIILPDQARFESLIQFANAKSILTRSQIEAVRMAQRQRNLIHLVKSGEVAGVAKLHDAIIDIAYAYDALDQRMPPVGDIWP